MISYFLFQIKVIVRVKDSETRNPWLLRFHYLEPRDLSSVAYNMTAVMTLELFVL